MKIDNIVEEKFNNLNDLDKIIWDYIRQNKSSIKNTSIQELAKKCQVSHTRILDFTRKIGLDGYSELKYIIKNELTNDSDDIEEVENKFLEALQDRSNNLRKIDFTKHCQMIYEARKIFIFCSGEIQLNIGMELKRTLALSKKLAFIVEGYDITELYYLIYKLQPNDLFILITHSGENKTVIEVANALKELKIHTIGICANSNTSIQKLVEEMITVDCKNYFNNNSKKEYILTSFLFVYFEYLHIEYQKYLKQIK